MTTFFFYIPLPPNTLPQKHLSHIIANTKNFTKKQFEVKPAGKSETASWENFISLLEKYFFSVEKLFFSSWALSEALFDVFLLVFDLLWLLSVNTKKFYVFIFVSTKERF